jgi:hypothetical protein
MRLLEGDTIRAMNAFSTSSSAALIFSLQLIRPLLTVLMVDSWTAVVSSLFHITKLLPSSARVHILTLGLLRSSGLDTDRWGGSWL